MKCSICNANIYTMPLCYDGNDNNLYCEYCYKDKLAGKGKVLTIINPSEHNKKAEKVLRQIKRVIKLKKEEGKILKSLDYYRKKLAEYVLEEGKEGGGFSYGMRVEINEDVNISASPLYSWNKKIGERTSVHIYNKKTNKEISIYSEKE